MLYYNKIDVSEGIDVNKTTESKECNIEKESIACMQQMPWFSNDVVWLVWTLVILLF